MYCAFLQKLDRSISAEMASPRTGCSPTSILTAPDSSSDSEADSSKPESSKAAGPQRKSLDAIYRSDSAVQGRTTAGTWQIPSGMTQHDSAAGERGQASGVQASASQQPGTVRKLPRQQHQGSRVVNHEPSTTTKGFTVRQSVATTAQAGAKGASISSTAADQQVTQQLPAASWARAQSRQTQKAMKVHERKPAAQEQKAVPGPIRQQQEAATQQHTSQQQGLFDLGLVRRSASSMKLARPATRRDFFGQPAIHTVKLGRAH